MINGLLSSSWKKRAQTLERLYRNYPDRPDLTLPLLIACLWDQEPTVRGLAELYLLRTPRQLIVAYLKDLLASKDPQIRFHAIQIAEFICSPFLLPILNPDIETEPRLRNKIKNLRNKVAL